MGGGVDRLSALSDDLLRRILHFVPSKEAASTSVLSRRWGSLWRSSGAVNLAAGEAFARAAAAALAAAEAPVTRLTLRAHTDGGDYSTIGQFLCRGRGWDTHVDVIGAVLSHHKARHVEDLGVTLANASDDAWVFLDGEIGWSQAIYSLVSLPSSETLRVLDLTRCHLEPLALPRLATLRLRFCSVPHKYVHALVDAAPELATVHLESVFFMLPPELRYLARFDHSRSVPVDTEESALCFRFRAVTTLVLALCGREEQGQAQPRARGNSSAWGIEIDAPRLRSFQYKGLLRRLLLRSAAPDLARVDLHFLQDKPRQGECEDKETARVLFWQFMQNFTSARALKLKMNHDLKEIAAVGKARRAALLHAFPSVERLELEGVHRPTSKTAAVAVANLLHCCPAVRDLTLRLSTVPPHSWKGTEYWRPFLGRKDRSDNSKSIDRFTRRSSKATTIVMEESSGDYGYDDVP
ncbi:hypothetical protein C2845_PM05G22880 [Panicum miliaceum]|uniref:F-box domain-containing protein n=1 Tax=Panicum miliaceum TaxID=4540 RepID=A0A3L6T339_PANMI|nr:hypothetical protein C2845_PM05G22880 [Panicum miliaceum]